MRQEQPVLPAPTVGGAPTAPPATQAITQVSPTEYFLAKQGARNQLREQHSRLLEQRRSVATRLREGGMAEGADKAGLEARLVDLDARIIDMEKQLGAADAEVAAAAGVPGVDVRPDFIQRGPPEELIVFGGLIGLAIVLPLSIGLARRIAGRGKAMLTGKVVSELDQRLNRLEQAVDSVAFEVERIGEGQRFVTNLFIESGAPLALGGGAMQPLDVRQREGAALSQRDPSR
jgi:hypothetical protein